MGGSAAQSQSVRSPLTTPAGKNTFGLDIHDPINHWPSEPFGFWRMWDASVDWSRVEPQPDVFDFALLDQYVSLAQQHNVQMIYVMGNTPAWLAQDPTAPCNEGIPGASSPPTDIQEWQKFVETLVTRYKGRIQAYETWNEANLVGYWTGSVTDMLQMTQIAYTTIKQIDPAATVLGPSVVGHTAISWMSQFLTAGGANYTDALAVHLYNTSRTPEGLVQFYQGAVALGQQWGKIVWDTEMGWGPWGTWSDTDAASFLARTFILQVAAGVTHIGWYAWDDRGAWVNLYLVQADKNTPTPAGIAFGEIQKWLRDSAVSCSSQSDGSWQCELTASDGKTKYMVWNPVASETFSIPAGWQVSQERDLQGDVQAISGNQIQIDSLPVLLEP
jgi:hypothetical protein